MAMAFIFEGAELSTEIYDGLMATMGLGDVDAAFPAGLIAHVAGPMGDTGFRVVDVWETEDAANAFYGSDQFAPVREASAGGGLSTTPWSIHRVSIPAANATVY